MMTKHSRAQFEGDGEKEKSETNTPTVSKPIAAGGGF
jgi:hypothetical protein